MGRGRAREMQCGAARACRLVDQHDAGDGERGLAVFGSGRQMERAGNWRWTLFST